MDAADDVWMLDEEGTLVRLRDGRTCALPNVDGVVQLARDRDGKLWMPAVGGWELSRKAGCKPMIRRYMGVTSKACVAAMMAACG